MTMKPWMKWIALALLLGMLAAGILRALSARSTQQEALATQQDAMKIPPPLEIQHQELLMVKMQELPLALPLSGALKATNSAVVKARVAGELQLLQVREGDSVKAGDTIARVDASEYQARLKQAQQQAESAKAQMDIAKRAFNNNRSLVEKGFISQTALEGSSSTLAAAEATFHAAQAGAEVAQKALDDTILRTPIGGVVSQRLAQPGERVAIDARIVEIVDLSHLELEASVDAANSLAIRIGQAAQLQIEGSNQTINAKVVRINPSTVAGSRAVMVYLVVVPQAGLRQGLFAQGTLAMGKQNVLAVPLSAVRTDKASPYVQKVVNNKVQHQTVKLGERSELKGEAWVRIDGVAQDSTVLAGSVGVLREGSLIQSAVPHSGKGK